MIRLVHNVLLCLAVCGAVLHSPVQAQRSEAAAEPGDATERARLHFKLGVDFYRERNFRAALIEFKRAYKAMPHYKLLYNLGQASLELQEDSTAIEYFTNYLRGGEDELDPARRQEVEQTITRLQARLALVTITTNQSGAEIYVDETLVGSAPLRDLVKVSVGRRRFSAVKHGFTSVERVVDVASGDHVAVLLEFKDKPQVDLAKVRAEAVAAAQRPPESTGLPAAAWAGVATAVVGAGAITLSILTVLAQKAYDDEKKLKTTGSRLEDLRHDAKTKALVTDITLGATAVSAVITTVLLIVAGGEEREPSTAQTSALRVELGATDLLVRGQF